MRGGLSRISLRSFGRRILLDKKIDARLIADAEFVRAFTNCGANGFGDVALELGEVDQGRVEAVIHACNIASIGYDRNGAGAG